jgi:hypothetical protein
MNILKNRKKQYYEDNKDTIHPKNKEYRDTHKAEMKEYKKKHYEINKDKIQVKNKEYYNNNKDLVNTVNKIYRDNHKAELSEYFKQYRENHKAKKSEYFKQYCENHKELIKERCLKLITCECGRQITHQCKFRHLKSKIHQQLMNELSLNSSETSTD